MYGNIIDNLNRQKDRIDEMIRMYQQPQPVNNFITTSQIPPRDLIEWRVLNENEEVDNLYVSTKTLFVGDSMMVLKGVDGSLEKYEIKKVYPIDKKDEKINQLEEEIKKLKEGLYELPRPDKSDEQSEQADEPTNVDGDADSTTSDKGSSKQK